MATAFSRHTEQPPHGRGWARHQDPPRGVYVNTLAITDHNLLELGDGVIIGDAVHISGHTIEHGVLKTGCVVLASDVTVGLGTVIGIGVVAATGCQIGALSFVPKEARLDAHATYAGVPVRKLGV